ncbi:unnamed protein product [Bursaphelenchus xylophilus]|uniref:(pine wood nematode) hypothetical protein n=1 Tax=Bursaphelenchus xylophilus TaxID=6326 RepID=A0A1I7RTP4_BURXY|nr:unnamed protein product [Bursaphelenchus xylophilus]CAG9122249.1 unnamed protein product [Bursaphelenchus xylophilus]
MTDTESTVISVPRADFEKIMKKIKATPYKSAYLSFCSAEFTLHFKIAGKEFHIPSYQILHPLNSNCQVMISASNGHWAIRLFGSIAKCTTSKGNEWDLRRQERLIIERVDTGSDVLWVPKLGCQSSGPLVRKCPNVDTYDPDASSTAEFAQISFSLEYGTGSTKGHYYLDNFAFGPKNGPQLKFKEKVKFGAGHTMRHIDDGILGLSFSDPKRTATNIFQQAVKEGLMDKPLFTVFTRECFGFCEDGGLITFGDFDKKNCCNVKGWAKALPGEVHWKFRMDGARIDDVELTSKVKLDDVELTSNVKAITDTGSSHIRMPKKDFKKIVALLNPVPRGGGHTLPCLTYFVLRFIINGIKYHIPSRYLLRIIGSAETCHLMLGEVDYEHWVLGEPFIRRYCQVHDVANRRIGFAPARY